MNWITLLTGITSTDCLPEKVFGLQGDADQRSRKLHW